jgi:hypothetical protein
MTAIDVGSVPQWISATAACVAVGVAWFQLRKVSESARRQANVVRADLMLKIDQIFEGKEMFESRLAIRTLRNQCEEVAKGERAGANDREVLDRSAQIFSEQLTKLWLDYKTADSAPTNADADLTRVPKDQAGPRYAVLMRLPYWMETVGLLTRKGLLQKDDVLDLYDAVYTGVLTCFEGHMRDRRDEKPMRNEAFLEHATWLLAKAREHRSTKLAAPRISGGKAN